MTLFMLASCDRAGTRERERHGDVALAPAAAPAPPSGRALPSRDEELRAFRDGLAIPAGLTGGARSLDALARRWVRAVEQRDSAAFDRLLLTRAEFAYLYYPTSPVGRPPYDLAPQLMWFQLIGNSEQGLRDALEAFGGSSVGYLGVRCDPAEAQGENRFHGNCLVRRRAPGGAIVEQRLFGAIIERGGRFKFVSYANRI